MSLQNRVSRRVRICHIAHGDLWAGAEVQLATLMEVLVGLPSLDLSAIVLNEGRLASELRRSGIPVEVLSETQCNSAQLLYRLVRYLRQHAPDVIHTHKYKDNVLGCSAAVVAGIPAVVRTVHGITEPFSGKAYVKMMGYDLIDRIVTSFKVKTLIAVSANIESVLRQMHGFDKVIRILNGINLDKVQSCVASMAVRESLGIGEDAYVIGTVGRLTAVKGHETLLQVVRSLKVTMSNLKCLIVGDGPLMQRFTRLLQDFGLEKEVILAGQRHDVYDLINCMDLFVLPSLHEGIPMVLLEALALNRPVVASRVGGIPEVVTHGRSGLLVEPGNTEELMNAVSLVVNDKSYGERLGRAGRLRVEEEFSATVMGQRTADLYSSLA